MKFNTLIYFYFISGSIYVIFLFSGGAFIWVLLSLLNYLMAKVYILNNIRYCVNIDFFLSYNGYLQY